MSKPKKELPRGHIAKNSREIARHGNHVDLIAPTSYGSHQVRVVEVPDVYGQKRLLAFDEYGNSLGYADPVGGGLFKLEDQHNISPAFDGVGGKVDVSSPHYWSNRDDARTLSGDYDPRGTSMGGYNPRNDRNNSG